MKKIIALVIGIGLIVGLSIYVANLSEQSKVSDDLSLIDFAISDTSKVDRIDIFDSFSNSNFTVKRNENNIWIDGDGNCVKQEIVQTMLETFLKVTLKGYVPSGAMENMKKVMMANHKQVKIYVNGSWVKTWYVGHSTSDHYGTHMLLETPKRKSDNPVIMGMKGFYGILGPRFTADPKMFQCSKLFGVDREAITRVKVTNTVSPEESFEITQSKSGVDATTMGQPLENLSKTDLLFYLNGFKNVHFNRPNYTLSKKDIEEMKSKTPDYRLEVETRNDSFEMDYYRRPDPENDDPDTLIWDMDYLWGIKPDGEVVRMQYHTLGPLIFGKDIFVNKSVDN